MWLQPKHMYIGTADLYGKQTDKLTFSFCISFYMILYIFLFNQFHDHILAMAVDKKVLHNF
jgi:hypothetical protein